MGWGAPATGDDLGWGGKASSGAQGCGCGLPPLELLERDNIAYPNDDISAHEHLSYALMLPSSQVVNLSMNAHASTAHVHYKHNATNK